MGLMDLLGGPDRGGLEDFAQRFDQGSPWEGFDEDEAQQRYQQVSQHLSQEEYEDSAREVFAKLSPQERREVAKLLKSRARDRGVHFDTSDHDDDDPGLLGSLVGSLQGREPGGLGSLLGGGGGGGGGLQKVILGGIAAMATKRFLGGR